MFGFIYPEKNRICEVLGKHSNLFTTVHNIDEDDNSRTYEKIFNDEFEKILDADKSEVLKNLAYFDALLEFEKFWTKENLKYRESNILNEFAKNEDAVCNGEKIDWQGTQKELGELFIELNRKGWLKEIPKDLIERYFTKAETIKQVLKPHTDTKQNKNLYSAIYTKAYRPKFDTIKPNKKRVE